MNIVRANEGKEYDAAGHFGGTFIGKQGLDIPGNKHLTVNLSHFQPGGGCDYTEFPQDWPLDLCYYVIKGEITVTTKNNEKFTLSAGDSVLWTGGDARGFVNESNDVTDLLVIVAQ